MLAPRAERTLRKRRLHRTSDLVIVLASTDMRKYQQSSMQMTQDDARILVPRDVRPCALLRQKSSVLPPTPASALGTDVWKASWTWTAPPRPLEIPYIGARH